jgi:hypothetical protein
MPKSITEIRSFIPGKKVFVDIPSHYNSIYGEWVRKTYNKKTGTIIETERTEYLYVKNLPFRCLVKVNDVPDNVCNTIWLLVHVLK